MSIEHLDLARKIIKIFNALLFIAMAFLVFQFLGDGWRGWTIVGLMMILVVSSFAEGIFYER